MKSTPRSPHLWRLSKFLFTFTSHRRHPLTTTAPMTYREAMPRRGDAALAIVLSTATAPTDRAAGWRSVDHRTASQLGLLARLFRPWTNAGRRGALTNTSLATPRIGARSTFIGLPPSKFGEPIFARHGLAGAG